MNPEHYAFHFKRMSSNQKVKPSALMTTGSVDQMKRMYFHFGFEPVVLFQQWSAESYAALIFSCLFFTILVIYFELLNWFRRLFLVESRSPVQEHLLTMSQPVEQLDIPDPSTQIVCYNGKLPDSDLISSGVGSSSSVSTSKIVPTVSEMFTFCNILSTFFYLLQVLLAYFIMLVFMLCNFWFCISILFGAAFSHFILTGRSTKLQYQNKHLRRERKISDSFCLFSWARSPPNSQNEQRLVLG